MFFEDAPKFFFVNFTKSPHQSSNVSNFEALYPSRISNIFLYRTIFNFSASPNYYLLQLFLKFRIN